MAMKVLALLALLCVALEFVAAGPYEGYKLYEIATETIAQRNALLALAQEDADKYDFLSLSRLHTQKARVLVAPAHDESFQAELRNKKIPFELKNTNFGRTIQTEVLQNRMLRQAKPYNGTGRLGTERYYSHEEINAYMDDLAARYPTRVYVRIVGKTYEGRILKTITITNGDGITGKNVIFMDGAFHAREWISPATVVYAIGELVENFEANAELLQDYDWVILPVVNADGYEYTQSSSSLRLWRKTRQPVTVNGVTWYHYGTDPNRNFGFHWMGKGASSNPCSEVYAGPSAFSEPEAVVVRDIMHTLSGRGIMYLTIHSFGNALFYPWGWGPELPDTWEDLDEVARAGADAIRDYSGTEYEVGSSTALYGEAAGASDDYAFSEGFTLAYTMELPDGGDSGFDPPPSDIDRLVKETWTGIRAMGKKITTKYPLPVTKTLS